MASWYCPELNRLLTPYHTSKEVEDHSWKNTNDPNWWFFGLVVKLHHDNVFVGNFWHQHQRQWCFFHVWTRSWNGKCSRTRDNLGTKKLAANCFWPLIRNAWQSQNGCGGVVFFNFFWPCQGFALALVRPFFYLHHGQGLEQKSGAARAKPWRGQKKV